MTAELLFIIMAFGAQIGFPVLFFTWRYRRSRKLLSRWVERQGYRLLDCERRWRIFGMKNMTSVLQITIEDPDGRKRSGEARISDWVTGVWSDRVDVEWDD